MQIERFGGKREKEKWIGGRGGERYIWLENFGLGLGKEDICAVNIVLNFY